MNRFFRSITVASLVALLVFTGGCDLISLNDNPNQPSDVETPKLLTNAQINIADNYWQDYAGGFWVRYAQYWTTNQYTDADRYAYASSRPGALNNLWEDYYLALNDLQEIIRLNQDPSPTTESFGPAANQIAIAQIMQAWTLHIMTDMWGPIPVENALNGRASLEGGEENEDVFTPSYDSGPDVYRTIINKLTQANNNIVTGEGTNTLGGGDIVYGGEMSKWKKFANSLKMRVALQASSRPGAGDTALQGQVETWLQEALDAGVFESNADNATIPFNTAPPYQNPFYENRVVNGRRDWAAPQSILGVMNGTDDPRRGAYFEPANEEGDFVGFPYGLTQGAAQSLFTSGSFSVPSSRVASSATAPCIMMLYDEVEFIKAEIAVRNDLNVTGAEGDPQTYYEDALEASMDYWGVLDSEANTFINNLPTDLTAGSNRDLRQRIGVQKWVAQYLQGVPGWSTWRRLDFTGVLQVPAGNPGQDAFGKDIAVRMVYPNDEASLNQENLNNAIDSLLGGDGSGAGDTQGVQLWWDTEYVDPQPE